MDHMLAPSYLVLDGPMAKEVSNLASYHLSMSTASSVKECGVSRKVPQALEPRCHGWMAHSRVLHVLPWIVADEIMTVLRVWPS